MTNVVKSIVPSIAIVDVLATMIDEPLKSLRPKAFPVAVIENPAVVSVAF